MVSDITAFGQAWLSRDGRLGISSALMEYAVQEHADTDGNRREIGIHTLRRALHDLIAEETKTC